MEIIILIESAVIVGLLIILNFYSKIVKEAKHRLNESVEINDSLRNEIKYLSKLNKTYSEGLDHFTKKHKGL